uniref:cAMP-specific 3',5'-cyclic phosphodiesterase 4D-like n=1 Tax=Callorhinchus milii TaxID=7868 RepID=A0A4W3JTR9_CALMI
MNKSNCNVAGNSESSTEEVSEANDTDPAALLGMEPYLVRRLSFRALQLPPLAFRLAEQFDWEKNSDTEHIPRPTTLALKAPPLIAITAADTSR